MKENINPKTIEWSVWTAISIIMIAIILTRPISVINLPPDSSKQGDDVFPSKDNSNIHTKQAPSYLTGIDVSHYQGDINWLMVAEQDIHFVFLKATEGITYIDTRYHTYQQSVNRYGIPNGAYHFFEPNDDGVKQANNFLDQIKIHKNMLPPVLDIEISKGIKKSLLQKRVRQWLDTVEVKTGCQPIIYSYGSFYDNYLGTEFDKYYLWLADYANTPTLPRTVEQWMFWQHTEKGRVPGIPNVVDKNRFQGNVIDLAKMMCKPVKINS